MAKYGMFAGERRLQSHSRLMAANLRGRTGLEARDTHCPLGWQIAAPLAHASELLEPDVSTQKAQPSSLGLSYFIYPTPERRSRADQTVPASSASAPRGFLAPFTRREPNRSRQPRKTSSTKSRPPIATPSVKYLTRWRITFEIARSLPRFSIAASSASTR